MTQQFVWQLNQVFPFLLIFARISATFTSIPGFGERFITIRMRLLLSFVIASLLFIVLMPYMPETPNNSWLFVYLIIVEVFVGFFIGMCARILFSALDIAGSIIGFKTGMMNAFVTSPVSGASGSLPGMFMGLAAVTLLFMTDTHHLIIKTLVNSYDLYNPSRLLHIFELSQETLITVFHVVVLSFTLAFQLSTPFIILGLLYFISLGILNRLMPQLPVFFIGQPLQLSIGLLLFMLVFSSSMDAFIENLRDLIVQFWDPKQIDIIE